MEIKFNVKDSVRIPDGCKAIIEDGMVIFVKEEKEQEFEDGDVLCSAYSGTMVIFKEEEKDGSRFFTLITTLTVVVIKVGIVQLFDTLPKKKRSCSLTK